MYDWTPTVSPGKPAGPFAVSEDTGSGEGKLTAALASKMGGTA